MRACVYCKTRYQKGSGITFHKFPTDTLIKELWLENMRMENWSPKSTDYLCSKHFTEDCFVKSVTRTNLKNGCVPTLYFGDKPTIHDKSVTPILCESDPAAEIKIELNDIDVHHENTRPDETGANDPLGFCPIPVVKTENINHDHYYEVPLSKSTSEICTSIRHDHRYENNPGTTNRIMQRIRRSLKTSRARVKLLTQHVKRLKNTVSSLKRYIRDLEKRR